MKQKDDYLTAIEQTPLFSIRKEAEPARYEREKNRLIDHIYRYKIKENEENAQFGLELLETVKSCIRYFDPQKGVFLHYFNRAFAQAKAKAQAERWLQESSCGVHFTDREKEQIRAVRAFLNTHTGVSEEALAGVLQEEETEEDAARKTGSEEIWVYHASISRSGDAEISEEDTETLFDRIVGEECVEETYERNETILTILRVCEEEYQKTRAKTKDLIAAKLTGLLADWPLAEAYQEEIRSKSYWREEIYLQTVQSGHPIKNKELSERYGASESNITQIWTRFRDRVKAEWEAEASEH